MFNPELANVLPNGALILHRKRVGQTWVWFAIRKHAYQPYVTWVSSVSEPGSTVWGRYWSRYINGFRDFHERIREQWSLLEQYS